MKLTVKFSALGRLVKKTGPRDFLYSPEHVVIDRTKDFLKGIALFSYLPEGMIFGEDIPFDSVTSPHGVLEYLGHQVMLYIEDQGQRIRDVLIKGERGENVHVAQCKILEEMRKKGKHQPYCVVSRMDGRFPVSGVDPLTKRQVEGDAALLVCPDCLETLNYKGYVQLTYGKKKAIIKDFDMKVFFKTYSSSFNALPRLEVEEETVIYPENWSLISAQIRRDADYTCQHCSVYLKEHLSLLYIEHINGVKSDQEISNLRALCLSCFKKLSLCSNMHIRHSLILKINRLRREQKLLEAFNYQKLEQLSDLALEGLIVKCRRHNLPVPDIGLFILKGNAILDIDLGWAEKKIAILLNLSNANAFEEQGWSVFTAHQALKDFNGFQKKVR